MYVERVILMNIKTVVVGSLETNCYILEKNKEVIIIDPGYDYDKIIIEVGDSKIVAILITHYHEDHIGALPEFIKQKIKVYSYENIKEKTYQISNFTFEVIYTKGHTDSSVSYYFPKENILFSGDFIFYESIGRWDLDTGNFSELVTSINKIKNRFTDLIIYPGHGIKTTLFHERQNNPYF